MEMEDIERKKFRTRVMGFDPGEVEAFIHEVIEEIRRLRAENENMKRDLQTQEIEIREHKEREKTIRAVLVSAHRNAEQIKANAERESKLIISEAEVKAEKILEDANNRLIRMEQEISEIRRNRIQFGAKMRSLLDSFRQILDEDGKDAFRKPEDKSAPAA